jgi:hypothetical protein
MRKLLFILLFPFIVKAQHPGIFFVGGGSAPFTPKSISGCIMWVYADTLGLSDSDPVTSWTDLSGNGNDAAQSSSGLKPLYKTGIQDGKDIIRFDGSDDFLEVANTSIIAGQTGMTVFLVVAQATLAVNKGIFCKWDYATAGCFAIQTDDVAGDEIMMYAASSGVDAGGNNQHSTNADLATQFYLLEYVYDGSQGTNADRVKIYRNGTLLTTSVTGTLPTSLTSVSSTLKLGMFGGILSRNYNGDMGEAILYTSALGTTDRQNVENYIHAQFPTMW